METLSKIIGALAIPIVLAVFGWLIQKQLAAENLSRDYIQLAVSILKEPKREGDDSLRAWAAELLNSYSRVKLADPTVAALTRGNLRLPDFGPGVTFQSEDAMSIVASGGGIVIDLRKDANGVNLIDVDHGSGVVTRYRFRSGRIVTVRGALVRRGDTLAILERNDQQTNEFTFQVLQSGKPSDPAPFLSGETGIAPVAPPNRRVPPSASSPPR